MKANHVIPWMTVVNDIKPAMGALILKDSQVIHSILAMTFGVRRIGGRLSILQLPMAFLELILIMKIFWQGIEYYIVHF